jgi:hypothetical protein
VTRIAEATAATLVAVLLAACGSSGTSTPAHRRSSTTSGGFRGTANARIPKSLLAGERPIGRGPRFQPALRGGPAGACSAELERRAQAHLELFGSNRVVLLSAGIGTRGPRRFLDGRLTHARCFGAIVTLDPTGTVYFRPAERLTLATLFREWGHALTRTQMASFVGRVSVYIDGHRSSGSPGSVQLAPNAEIVLEVGPHVRPHARFSFPSLPSVSPS